eukprot:1095237-Amphidinium_carterae.1
MASQYSLPTLASTQAGQQPSAMPEPKWSRLEICSINIRVFFHHCFTPHKHPQAEDVYASSDLRG